MFKNNYENTYFLSSNVYVKTQKNPNISEIVFVGYSNSGKSSAINVLTNKKKLARISKTPGRTQLINFFAVTKKHYLVDMPGYGYAKVAKSLRLKWETTIVKYLTMRTCLKGLVLFMDIRYPMKPFDENLLNIAVRYKIPVLVLLTKSDKIIFDNRKKQLKIVTEKLSKFALSSFNIYLFSSLKKIGIDALRTRLDYWYSQSN
ncbi:MAG TPA: ribosome biogenesis GTP-binding protein YihA/YsxC [Buchnera sp. (in: enterobacteria)]|nr:ribosome biogenesis GTP-binding protein YihA/YsxC [Buchnera sp. (in: enterobacteria)]